MQRVGPDVGLVLGQAVKDVHGLPNAAGDEMREQRDVIVADVIVGNAAIPAVADMALRQQVVLVQVPLCAVGRRAFRVAPIAR